MNQTPPPSGLQPQKKKGGALSVILAIVFAILIAGGGAVGTYFMLSPQISSVDSKVSSISQDDTAVENRLDSLEDKIETLETAAEEAEATRSSGTTTGSSSTSTMDTSDWKDYTHASSGLVFKFPSDVDALSNWPATSPSDQEVTEMVVISETLGPDEEGEFPHQSVRIPFDADGNRTVVDSDLQAGDLVLSGMTKAGATNGARNILEATADGVSVGYTFTELEVCDTQLSRHLDIQTEEELVLIRYQAPISVHADELLEAGYLVKPEDNEEFGEGCVGLDYMWAESSDRKDLKADLEAGTAPTMTQAWYDEFNALLETLSF